MSSSAEFARRRWWILVSATVGFFAVGATFFAVPPLVPELITRFRLSQFEIGILMGAIAVPAVALSIPLGAAVDRWPARAAGVVSLLLMVTGGVLFAIAPGYPVLLLGRLVFGIGGLVLNLLLARLITAAFAQHELSLAMGLFHSVYPASMIVMFSLHPRLNLALGWRGELLALTGLAAMAVPVHLLAVPPDRGGAPDRTSAHRPTVGRNLGALAAAWMLFFASFASILTFAPQWAGGDGRALLVVSLVMWTALVLNPLVGVAIDRWGHANRCQLGGLLVLAVTLGAMAIAPIPPTLAMVLVGCAAAAVLTSTYSLPGHLVPPAQVGFAFGFITAFSNLATLVGPATAGALLDVGRGWAAVWGVLAAGCLLGAAASATIGTAPAVEHSRQ
jgi:predicted MFS family arabinose efflux permease